MDCTDNGFRQLNQHGLLINKGYNIKKLSKKRQAIFDKSGGYCWYCGDELIDGWHADHVEPIRRYKNIKVTETGVKHFVDCDNPHLDNDNNLVPACRKCNLFKSVFSIEEFRQELTYQVERARSYSVNFRSAERFGLITVTNKPVVFWFEKNIGV